MQERCPTNSELLSTDPAVLAMVLFIDASDDFPASQLHIGAAIALECKKLDNASPRALREALLPRSDIISKLIKSALIRHKNNERAPKKIQPPTMESLVEDVFGHADNFMCVPSEELNKFLLTYIPKNNPANFVLMDVATALINRHKPPEIWHGRPIRPTRRPTGNYTT